MTSTEHSTRRAGLCVALAITASTGCATTRPSWLPEDTTTGLVDARLVDLTARYWAWTLADDPTNATELGVHALDDRLADRSAAGVAARRADIRGFRGELAQLTPALEVPSDRTSAELLLAALEAQVASEVCEFHEWSISVGRSPVSEWNYLPQLHPVSTPEDGQALLARYRGIARSIDDDLANLRRGLAGGRVANAESVRRVTVMLKDQLAQPREAWPLLAPARAERPGWSEEARTSLARELTAVVEAEVVPALGRYLAALEGEIAPAARPSDRTGLGALPGGEACYRAQVLRFTGLPLEPREVHASGLAEIAELDRALAELGQRALGTTDLASTLARLRTDPALYFATAEEVQAKAEAALARAQAATPRYFGLQPKARCEVVRVPDYEAPFTTIAYYRQPVPDGSKPGQYFVNVHAPTTRPRFEAAVLAFHESVPGHHLQIAIAQELPALPAFRKQLDATAFVEGWALYTERLAEEMGLYADDLDRLGMLSFDAWRASRLVVDTGLHALGWSREQAIQFMLEHTALSRTNIENEVDRYITWPGQALAYKTGQRELWRLRREAEARLGTRFSLPAFHDVVLGQGAVSLPILARQVEAWVTQVEREAPPPGTAPAGSP